MRAKPDPFGSPNIPAPPPVVLESDPVDVPAPDLTKGEPTGEGVQSTPVSGTG